MNEPSKHRIFLLLFHAALWPLFTGLGFIFQSSGLFSAEIFGLVPRDPHHLHGILVAPFLHGDFSHWIGNASTLAVLSALLYTHYPRIFFPANFWIWLLAYGYAWLFARNGLHIGASGMVYGFAAFLTGAGLITRNRKALAAAFIVIFLYGSAIWGILPLQPGVSWETHLYGVLAGLFVLWKFRKALPKPEPKTASSELQSAEDPDEADSSDPYQKLRSMEKNWDNT